MSRRAHLNDGSPSSESYQHVGTSRAPRGTNTDPEEYADERETGTGNSEGDVSELHSDDDERMSDYKGGSAASSDAESAATGMVSPHQMTYIGLTQCRIKTSVKTENGVRVQCICGRETTACRRHTKQRIGGRTRHPTGYYVACIASQGGHLHGKLGTCISQAEWEARIAEEKEQAEEDIEAQQDAASDDEEEEVRNLRRENRRGVGFNLDETPAVRVETTSEEEAQEGLDLSSAFDATRVTEGSNQDNPGPWYGLEDRTGGRWITKDPEEADFLGKAHFELKRLFKSKEDAREWATQGSPFEKLGETDDAPQHPKGGGKAKASKSKTKKRPSRKTRRKPDYPSDDEPSDDSEDSYESKDSSSEDSSSEDSSEEETSSSGASSASWSNTSRESSDSRGRSSRRRQRRRNRSTSRGRKKRSSRSTRKKGKTKSKGKIRRGKSTGRRKKGSKRTKSRRRRRETARKLYNVDPSVGNSRMIYGEHVPLIRSSAGPPGMRTKDTDELFEAALDVSELPGTSVSKYIKAEAQLDAETQGAMQVAQAVIQAHGGSGAKVYDQTWMSIRRHGLRYVKDGATLLEVTKNVKKAKEAAFTRQTNRIYDFMCRRNYNEEEIDLYLAGGFLPKIVAASFENYYSLLVQARELHMNHPDEWEGGPAASLINHHSEKLLTIRMNADSRRDLILRTYVHLRDSARRSFYHESQTEALWDRMATLSEKLAASNNRRGGGGGGGGGDRGGENKSPRCSHCKSSELHKAMKVGIGKADCPLTDLGGKEARKAAKEIMTEAAATTDADVSVILAGKLSESK